MLQDRNCSWEGSIGTWNVLYKPIKLISSNVPFKAAVSLLTFRPNEQSTDVTRVLKSPSVIVCCEFLFKCVKNCCIYFGAFMLGAYILITVIVLLLNFLLYFYILSIFISSYLQNSVNSVLADTRMTKPGIFRLPFAWSIIPSLWAYACL